MLKAQIRLLAARRIFRIISSLLSVRVSAQALHFFVVYELQIFTNEFTFTGFPSASVPTQARPSLKPVGKHAQSLFSNGELAKNLFVLLESEETEGSGKNAKLQACSIQ